MNETILADLGYIQKYAAEIAAAIKEDRTNEALPQVAGDRIIELAGNVKRFLNGES